MITWVNTETKINTARVGFRLETFKVYSVKLDHG